ncbi:hypothetical protein AMJ49_05240 [Parcubacteria bacterium DG_74_2]|nr:MAG: hypothetical protein AMJ49_05240 [Parcubacteria bacterium DG_74_2]
MKGFIPQSVVKKTKHQDLLFYFSLILLVISILSYFALDSFFIKNSSDTLEDLEKQIAEKETSEVRSLEKKVLIYQEKIEDFLFLLNSQKSVLGLFTFLESNCYPKVWFSDFSFNMETGTVNLSGQAESFTALDKQLFILKQKTEIKELNLSSISLGEQGRAEFGLNIIFNQEVLNP